MQISEIEYAALIRKSSASNVVEASFGPRGVRLSDTPQNQWAVDMIKSIRDKNKASGASQA